MGKDKKYHLNKTKEATESNYQLIHIFSSEWENKKHIVKSRISSMLGVNARKVGARECTVKEISVEEGRKFLDLNHLQGYVGAKVKIGLFFKDELIAVQTFGVPRFNKDFEWELLRFASATNTHIVGGASKLFKYFIKNYNPKSILSYSDLRWGSGAVYEKLGFEHIRNSEPNYFYFKKSNNLESRLKYQKHKLPNLLPNFSEELTEYQNMLNNGYNRIYDCGNAVFSWTK